MSVDLSCTVDTVDGVCFVACRVRNDADVPRRVRIDSRLNGPVLPPRRSGVPEAGWDRDGVTLRLESRETRGVGFASPATPVDPPATVVGVDTLDAVDPPDATDVTHEDGELEVAEAIRTLGTHRPPRAAVRAGGPAVRVGGPAVRAGGPADSEPATATQHDDSVGSTDQENPESVSVRRVAEGDGDSASEYPSVRPHADENENGPGVDANEEGPRIGGPRTDEEEGGSDVDDDGGFSPIGPVRLDQWFAAVERRVDRAERLADADLDAATEHVAAIGGVDAVAALDERVDADAALLRRVSDRAAELADRAEATDAPVAALERLS